MARRLTPAGLARLVRGAAVHPGRAVLGWLIVALLSAWGATQLRVDTSADSVLDRADPAYAFHRHSQELFGGEELIVVALESAEGWDPVALAEVVRLTDEFEGVIAVRRVDSLESVPLVRATADGGLDLSSALDHGVPETEAGRAALARDVLADRIAPRTLVSDDGRVLALNLLLDAEPDGRFLEIVESVRSAIDPERIRVSGVPVFRTEVNARTRAELTLFVPLTLAIIAALLALFFRSVAAVVISLLSSGAGVVVMLGVMGLAGASIGLLTFMLPSVVLALGSAYAMHMLAAAQASSDDASLLDALEKTSVPVTLSGSTTAIGLVAIGAVRIEAVRDVGMFGAVGVLAVLAATLTLTPALLRLWRLPKRSPRLAAWLRGPCGAGITRWSSRRPRRIIVGWVIALVPLGLGAGLLDVYTDATNWFPPGTKVRDDYDWIRQKLSGFSPVNIVIESEAGERVTSPEAVRAIDALRTHLESLPEVSRAIAYTDPLRQLHGGFVDDPAQPLPSGQPLVEQYLLLLESVEQLEDLISDDRSAANVLLRVDDNRSGALRWVALEAQRWWDEHGPAGFAARGTGTMFEFARAEDAIAYGQLRGLAFAFAAVALILLAVFRSWRLALLALLPNVVPVVSTFGFMGLIGVPLDAGTVIVGSLALGIAVDDTMHVLSRFHTSWRGGASTVEAVDEALQKTLPALSYTTLVIALGFGVLGLSEFTLTRNLGVIVAGVMLLCFAADVILLPALLCAVSLGRASARARE